jgi:hypothetical protein
VNIPKNVQAAMFAGIGSVLFSATIIVTRGRHPFPIVCGILISLGALLILAGGVIQLRRSKK